MGSARAGAVEEIRRRATKAARGDEATRFSGIRGATPVDNHVLGTRILAFVAASNEQGIKLKCDAGK